MERLNVAVLLGGESVESDISIITGVQVFNALDENKYNKILIYIDKNGKWWKCEGGVKNAKDVLNCKKCEIVLKSGDNNLFLIKGRKLKLAMPLHCAVLALHGGFGENGAVQGFLKMCKIPFTSSESISSGLTMDKCITKLILKGGAIPTLPYVSLKKIDYYENEEKNIEKIIKKLNFPLIIKPACLGSSIGINVAHNEEELYNSINFAFKFDNKLLIETALTDFYELNISARIVNGKIALSQIEKPQKTDEILSFCDKYQSNIAVKGGNGCKATKFGADANCNEGSKGMANLKRECPANIDKDMEQELKLLAKRIYKLFDCLGIVRLDFLVRSDGKLFLNEINSIPGSLSFYLWGKERFGNIIDEEINNAIKRKLLDDDLIKNFDSSIF